MRTRSHRYEIWHLLDNQSKKKGRTLMKKHFVLTLQTAFCVLLTTAAFAQSGRTSQPQTDAQKPQTEQASANRREEQSAPRQAPEIPNLTDEQKGQLQTIRQQSREQIEAVRNDSTMSDDERRTRIDSIRQTSREQSQGVLTPEQREAVANQRANGRSNGEGRPNTNGQGNGGERRAGANGQGQQGGNRPQMGGQNGGVGGGGFGGPRGGQGGGMGGPRGGGGRGGGRP
jgi:Spy/CpxP family protein refolding chaperone